MSWVCACGWAGPTAELLEGPGGIRVCPGIDCGGSGSLQLDPDDDGTDDLPEVDIGWGTQWN